MVPHAEDERHDNDERHDGEDGALTSLGDDIVGIEEYILEAIENMHGRNGTGNYG